MITHISNIFSFDEELTRNGYDKLSLSFVNENIKNLCLQKLSKPLERNHMNIGIDYSKPWEELELDGEHFQIEYLFVGQLLDSKSDYIKDANIGINYQELRFGIKEWRQNKSSMLNCLFVLTLRCSTLT